MAGDGQAALSRAAGAGHSYVVRAVRVGVKADELIMDMRRVLEPSLLLVGLYNPTNNLGVEAGFAASRFRALDELKQSATEEDVKEDAVAV